MTKPSSEGSIQRRFTKPGTISKHLICPVCMQVFNKPFRLFCSHTLCLQCLVRCTQRQSICPVCREPIDANNIGVDNTALYIINELQVYCSNFDCIWKGQLSLLVLHIQNQCMFKNLNKKQGNSVELPDDEETDKINENTNKGSLFARIIQNNPAQSQDNWMKEAMKMLNKTPQMKKKERVLRGKNEKSKKNEEISYLQQLLESDEK